MKHNRRQPKKRTSPSVLKQVNVACQLVSQCGSAENFVAVPPERDRSTCPFLQEFRRPIFIGSPTVLAEYAAMTCVAMESTGVYWIALYEILEARGFQRPAWSYARHVKNVPGRKSDVSHCEWLRELHSLG